MAIDLQYQGNDDNALDVLAALADLAVPANVGTENRIRSLAAAADVDIAAYAESDRNLIERLAALLDEVVPYVLRLDDDGTLAAMFGHGHMPTAAPAYLVAVHDYETASPNETYSATISSLENSVDLSAGGVFAYQLNIDSSAEAIGGVGASYRAMAATSFALLAEGVPALQLTIGIYVDRDNVTVRGYIDPDDPAIFSDEIVGYVPGEHKIAVYIDATLGKVGYTLDGADQGYIDGVVVGEVDALAPALLVEQGGDITAEAWQVTLEMVPSAAGITEPVPAGAKDLYEQAI